MVLSCFSKVPDFSLMLVTVRLVVNLPSTAEREGAGWVKDHESAPPWHLLTPSGAVPRAGLVLRRDEAQLPSLNLSRWTPSHSQPCTHPKPSPAAL